MLYASEIKSGSLQPLLFLGNIPKFSILDIYVVSSFKFISSIIDNIPKILNIPDLFFFY